MTKLPEISFDKTLEKSAIMRSWANSQTGR